MNPMIELEELVRATVTLEDPDRFGSSSYSVGKFRAEWLMAQGQGPGFGSGPVKKPEDFYLRFDSVAAPVGPNIWKLSTPVEIYVPWQAGGATDSTRLAYALDVIRRIAHHVPKENEEEWEGIQNALRPNTGPEA